MYFPFRCRIFGANYLRKKKKKFHFLQELADLRSSDLKSFKDIQVDEANLLVWNGLIVPVSCFFLILISFLNSLRVLTFKRKYFVSFFPRRDYKFLVNFIQKNFMSHILA